MRLPSRRYIILEKAPNIMKRQTLIRHLTSYGAILLREGRRHSIYQKGKHRTAVPRHSEIVDELARKICKDLDIPFPK